MTHSVKKYMLSMAKNTDPIGYVLEKIATHIPKEFK